jgi:hypothetical protein
MPGGARLRRTSSRKSDFSETLFAKASFLRTVFQLLRHAFAVTDFFTDIDMV